MSDLYILFAKIQALPKRRIAEVEDFVDFLARRSAARPAKPPAATPPYSILLNTDTLSQPGEEP